MFRDMCLKTFCYPHLIIMLTPQQFQQGIITESNKIYLESVWIYYHHTTLSSLKHVDGGRGGGGNGGSGGVDVNDDDVDDNNNM